MSTTKATTATVTEEAAAPKKYRVLCWGACTPESPCSIDYPSTTGSGRKIAVTGDVVSDIPHSDIGKPGHEGLRSLILGTHIEEAVS